MKEYINRAAITKDDCFVIPFNILFHKGKTDIKSIKMLIKLIYKRTPPELKPAKGAIRDRKRIGRGNASGHGTYSCRGMNGQTARSGGKRRPRFSIYETQFLYSKYLRFLNPTIDKD